MICFEVTAFRSDMSFVFAAIVIDEKKWKGTWVGSRSSQFHCSLSRHCEVKKCGEWLGCEGLGLYGLAGVFLWRMFGFWFFRDVIIPAFFASCLCLDGLALANELYVRDGIYCGIIDFLTGLKFIPW